MPFGREPLPASLVPGGSPTDDRRPTWLLAAPALGWLLVGLELAVAAAVFDAEFFAWSGGPCDVCGLLLAAGNAMLAGWGLLVLFAFVCTLAAQGLALVEGAALRLWLWSLAGQAPLVGGLATFGLLSELAARPHVQGMALFVGLLVAPLAPAWCVLAWGALRRPRRPLREELVSLVALVATPGALVGAGVTTIWADLAPFRLHGLLVTDDLAAGLSACFALLCAFAALRAALAPGPSPQAGAPRSP